MKKLFAAALALFACIGTLIFVSCPQEPQITPGQEVVTTFKISSLPDYIESINFYLNQDGENYVFGCSKSDNFISYPYEYPVYAGTAINNQPVSIGSELYVRVEFNDNLIDDYIPVGTLPGEKPFKLLVNGIALTETPQTFEEVTWTNNGTTEPTGRTYNLQQRDIYKAKFTLGSTVELSFDKGDLRNLEPGAVKYKGTTGFSYIKVENKKNYDSLQVDYEDAGNTYQAIDVYGMYAVPVNKNVRVIFYPKNGWELDKISFKANNSALQETENYGIERNFYGKVTSLAEGQILNISGTTTALKDNLAAKNVTLVSKFKKDGSSNVSEAANELMISFKDFTEGAADNKVTVKTSSQELNATWYYINSSEIYIDLGSGNGYRIYKEDEAWVAGTFDSTYYFADKSITGIYQTTAQDGYFIIYPVFLGFTPNDNEVEVIIDGNKNAQVLKGGIGDTYTVFIDESWHLNSKESHTYYVKAGDTKSAECALLIKQIFLSLPANTSTFEIGPALELTAEYLNFEEYEQTSERDWCLRATGEHYPVNKYDNDDNWTERYIEFQVNIVDGKILVPTYKFLNEETTLYLCSGGRDETPDYSNKVTLNFTYPDATLTIGGEETENLNKARPVIGEDNLYSYTFSKNISLYKAEALVTVVGLQKQLNDNQEEIEVEYSSEQFYLPVNDDGTFSLCKEYSKSYDSLETDNEYLDIGFTPGCKYQIKEAKLCGITATGTVTFIPLGRDTRTITIDTTPIEVTSGTSIRVPLTLNPAPTEWENATVYMGTYQEGDEDQVPDYGLNAFEIKAGQTEIVLPTYGTDSAEGYLYLSTRDADGAYSYIPVKSESKKFKISPAEGSISFKFLKEATPEEPEEESASVNVTESDYWSLQRVLKASRTFTGDSANYTPEEPYFILYARPSTYDATYSTLIRDELVLNEDGIVCYEEYDGTKYPANYNMLMNELSNRNFNFQVGEQYIFWLESCGIKSDEITVNMVSNE